MPHFRIPLVLIASSFLISCTDSSEWTELLDPEFSKWESYLSYQHTTDFDGSIPKDSLGTKISPIGYQGLPNSVFSIIEENNEPVLRVSGETYGCVFTKESYENYHLKLKVKWGTKKWPPREDKLKDTGILYHSVGECGVDYWRSWMLSQEFQIMEGHMGDYWSIANSAIDIRAYQPEGMMNPVADPAQPYLSIGAGTEIPGFCMRSAAYDKSDWTELELICFDGKSVHVVNGQVVMVLANSRYFKDGKHVPLKSGKIQLQSEAAEAYFKDIKIRPISSIPEVYAALF